MTTGVMLLQAVCFVAFVAHTTLATSSACTSMHCDKLENQVRGLTALVSRLQHSLEQQQQQQQQQIQQQQHIYQDQQLKPITLNMTGEQQQKQLATLQQIVEEQQNKLEKQEQVIRELKNARETITPIVTTTTTSSATTTPSTTPTSKTTTTSSTTSIPTSATHPTSTPSLTSTTASATPSSLTFANGLTTKITPISSTTSATPSSPTPATTPTSTPTTISNELAADCAELLKKGYFTNGVYNITVAGDTFEIFCDQTTDNGGWLVFQRRIDNNVDFYINWASYKNGFGNLSGNLWLGNDKLHAITARKKYTLRIDVADFDNKTRYAEYTYFAVANETNKYRLTLRSYSGIAGDSLVYHNGMAFSTLDRDNDWWSTGSCAHKDMGGWWYKRCADSNLNGLYLVGANKYSDRGVVWDRWHDSFYSLMTTTMKIRPQ